MVQPPGPMMGITLYGTKATATATFEDFQPCQFRIVFDAIREMMEPSVPDPPRKRIGFDTEWEEGSAGKRVKGKSRGVDGQRPARYSGRP